MLSPKMLAAAALAFLRNRPGDEHADYAASVDDTYNRLHERTILEQAFGLIERRLDDLDMMACDFRDYRTARDVLAVEIARRRRP